LTARLTLHRQHIAQHQLDHRLLLLLLSLGLLLLLLLC
jgi:hypothetical protein